MLDMTARQWKQDVLETATDRFERRLSEESGAIRLEVASVRLEVADVRLEIAKSRNSIHRWMFAYWLTTMLAMVEGLRIISAR